MGKRLDAEDTAESAIHFIQKQMVEGWGVDDLHWQVDFGRPGPKGKRIPIGATITIHLKPALER